MTSTEVVRREQHGWFIWPRRFMSSSITGEDVLSIGRVAILSTITASNREFVVVVLVR